VQAQYHSIVKINDAIKLKKNDSEENRERKQEMHFLAQSFEPLFTLADNFSTWLDQPIIS